MKKLLVTLTLLALLGFLSGCAWLERPTPDYRTMLLESAVRADEEAGRAGARARDAWLAESGSGDARIDFDELLQLSRYLTLRAGDERLSEEQRLCTGEILLNRVASPEFPDTLTEVLAQAEPALPADLRPDRRCAEAAWELLSGRRLLDSRVVWQSAGRPHGSIYATFCDRYCRVTYFCLTDHPELYG